MRASAVSFIHKLTAAALAASLTLSLAPTAYAEGESSSDDNSGVVASALADQSNDSTDSSLGESQGVSAEQDTEGSPVAPMLASGLVGKPSSFISSDVTLDSEPIIGSFSVDGLTYAVIDGPYVELVGVSPDWQQVMNSQEGKGFGAAPMLASGSDGAETDASTLALPEAVTYSGVNYTLASIAPYAFYLSGVTDLTLPASVSDVDDRAFRSSDVASVAVAEGNPTYSFFDGALYDAEQLSLLLIPEGKQGTVRIPKTAEVVDSSVFSHCPLADSISVDAGSAAFASENGLLYTSGLTTLLRVPAGATEITIREGCTTIAAGALEACAKLTTINAPSSVTTINPDVFHAIPTVSLPAASLTEGTPQLSAVVALLTIDNDQLEINPSTIEMLLPDGASNDAWENAGFSLRANRSDAYSITASVQDSSVYAATGCYGFFPADCDIWRYDTSDSQWVNLGQENPERHKLVRWSNRNAIRFYQGKVWYCTANGTNDYGFICIGSKDGGVLTVDAGSSPSSLRSLAPSTTYISLSPNSFFSINKAHLTFTINWNANGGNETQSTTVGGGSRPTAPLPKRHGYAFNGWYTAPEGGNRICGADEKIPTAIFANATYYAQWERVEYDLDFDVDSEPDDEDYKGEPKDDQTVNIEDGPTIIEDPKRPGYVFQGWVIPNVEGTEAIDQDLVYEGEDGKWYVDASKLPDYAGDDGRVELTARWTSVISVDVPSSVTFYADVVTQGNESREGLASSAFGQSKVASQSEVDLRIVGLESKQVKSNGSTSLGASDILKKKDGSDLPATSDKLFSLYPATGELKEDDLKDPDATSASKPEGAVDFSLDDILLERSFAADEFTIPAGDTLSLGYRLNLQETSTELDYDKLSALSEGTSASIANIIYCFAADALPSDWGEPLWIENPDHTSNPAKYLLLKDIKAAADDLSANGTSSTYYSMYKSMLDSQVTNNGNAGRGPYFQLKVGNAYIDLQLIGICQDTKSAGGKAGLTFQTRDIYAYSNKTSTAAGGGAFPSYMNEKSDSSSGWEGSAMRERLSGEKLDGSASSMTPTYWESLDAAMQAAVAPVDKFQQLPSGTTASFLQKTTSETIWLPSMHEVLGTISTNFNESEGLTTVVGYTPFQYMAYQPGGTSTTNTHAIKAYNGSASYWWLRTARRSSTDIFCTVGPYGDRNSSYANVTRGAAPCFCL